MLRTIYIIVLSIFFISAINGCVPAAVTGAGVVGYTAVQERTVGDAVDDVTISTKIEAMLYDKKIAGLLDSIDVDVTEGRVLLTGKVKKVEDRIEAVKIAWKVEGVKEVINEIQVTDKSSLKLYSKDIWITSKVKTKLLFDKNIKSVNYSVDTVNGVVYLMGIAQDQAELDRATKAVSTVDGVKKVVSHVILKDDPSRK